MSTNLLSESKVCCFNRNSSALKYMYGLKKGTPPLRFLTEKPQEPCAAVNYIHTIDLRP